MEITTGRRRRPKSSKGFGSSQPRFGLRGPNAGNKSKSRIHDILDNERAKVDAERTRAINQNFKIFQDALKAELDKPDDEVFNA